MGYTSFRQKLCIPDLRKLFVSVVTRWKLTWCSSFLMCYVFIGSGNKTVKLPLLSSANSTVKCFCMHTKENRYVWYFPSPRSVTGPIKIGTSWDFRLKLNTNTERKWASAARQRKLRRLDNCSWLNKMTLGVLCNWHCAAWMKSSFHVWSDISNCNSSARFHKLLEWSPCCRLSETFSTHFLFLGCFQWSPLNSC